MTIPYTCDSNTHESYDRSATLMPVCLPLMLYTKNMFGMYVTVLQLLLNYAVRSMCIAHELPYRNYRGRCKDIISFKVRLHTTFDI